MTQVPPDGCLFLDVKALLKGKATSLGITVFERYGIDGPVNYMFVAPVKQLDKKELGALVSEIGGLCTPLAENSAVVPFRTDQEHAYLARVVVDDTVVVVIYPSLKSATSQLRDSSGGNTVPPLEIPVSNARELAAVA